MNNNQFKQLMELNMRMQQNMQAQQQQQFLLQQQQNQIMQHNQLQMLQHQQIVRQQMLQVHMMQQQQQQFFLMMASGCSGNRAILPSTSQLFPTGTTKMIDYRPEEQATTNSPDVIIEQGQREENPSTSKVTDELDLSDNVVGNKRKRHSSGASEEPCTRQLRSRGRLGTIPASVEKPCNIFLKNDELIEKLNEISPDMKVQDLDEKKRLRAEAENLLEEIKKDDCKDHISKLANGIIVAVERSGLGPFALFQDLQHTLLDIIDDLSGLCGAYLKYQVLLPEAIIFGYCKLKGCEYSVGVKMFEASSKLIAE